MSNDRQQKIEALTTLARNANRRAEALSTRGERCLAEANPEAAALFDLGAAICGLESGILAVACVALAPEPSSEPDTTVEFPAD